MHGETVKFMKNIFEWHVDYYSEQTCADTFEIRVTLCRENRVFLSVTFVICVKWNSRIAYSGRY